MNVRTFHVTYDRIGHTHDLEHDITIANIPDDLVCDILAGQVHGFARHHLGSKEWQATVTLEDHPPAPLQGRVSIAGGRFGTGRIVETTTLNATYDDQSAGLDPTRMARLAAGATDDTPHGFAAGQASPL